MSNISKDEIITTLPPELQLHVCLYLTQRDLVQCSHVNREWSRIFNQESIWKLKPEESPDIDVPQEVLDVCSKLPTGPYRQQFITTSRLVLCVHIMNKTSSNHFTY